MFNKNWPEEDPKTECGCSGGNMCSFHFTEYLRKVNKQVTQSYYYTTTAATTYNDLERNQYTWWRNGNNG